MVSASNHQQIVFKNEPLFGIEDEPELDLFDEGVAEDSMVIRTFSHLSGAAGLQISVSDANGEGHFFLTPAEASQLRRWLNERDL